MEVERVSVRPRLLRTYILTAPFILGTILSAIYAVTLLRAYCEGFSCTYLGVGWLAWIVVLFVPTAGYGLAIQRLAHLPPAMKAVIRRTLIGHLLIGAGLFLWWLHKR